MPSAKEYDIFISYAREDSQWVRENLYEPLLRCRKADGSRPRIFFDVGEEGIAIGQNFMTAITEAILNSKKFVPVYSSHYFRKKMCGFELGKAHMLDPWGEAGKLIPILVDPQAESLVPFAYNHINYWGVTSLDWFEKLCKALELVTHEEHTSLQFLDQPSEIAVNHTLPQLRVAVMGENGISPRAELIAISAEEGVIEGTLSVMSEGGIAVFADLSMSAAVETRLIATAEGCDPVYSEPFSVVKPVIVAPVIEETPDEQETNPKPRIPLKGEAVFFADGRAIAVIGQEQAAVYDLTGKPLSSEQVKLASRVRLVRRGGRMIALADWAGRVCLFQEDGRHRVHQFENNRGFLVPGDIAIADGKAHIGFWNGMVYRMSVDEAPVLELRHDAGVQALAVVGERFYVCGFDGRLCVYKGGRMINAETLEPSVELLQASDGCLIAVGRNRLYQIALSPLRVLSEELPLSGAADVLGDLALPVVIDSRGKGIRFNKELALKASFHTTAGAVPVSADDAGRYSVFANPDGSRTLMIDGRVVFSHLAGTLSVAPDAEHFALGDETGVRVMNKSLFDSVSQGGD